MTQAGFHCDTTGEAGVALQMCDRHQYDLVISDLKMPGMNGHAFCAQLIGRGDCQPLVCVLTGIMNPGLNRI
ncbi:MAG: response regulator [Gimesia chilikensis]|uniref:response regulator n=1 Tax=Gimesia chilikensis TaxID=2605989 RepID=UPI0037A90BD6